jgi:transcriptional regulator with XRE-family HTH domain
MSRIGEKMKNIRTNKKLSQTELGKMMGVSGSYISRIEIKNEIPSDTFIFLFCQIFFIREEWLLKDEGPMIKTANDVVNDLCKYLDFFTLTEVVHLLTKSSNKGGTDQ